MTPGQFKLVLVFFLLGLGACESSMTVQAPADDVFVSRVRDQAIRLELAGDLSRAVYQWQVVVGLRSNDPQANAELKRLQKIIRGKIIQLESDFEKARTTGNNRRQKLIALKLLALDGTHSAAREYLQASEYKAALVMQSQKDRDALQAQAKRQEKAGREMAMQIQKQQNEKNRLRANADKAEKLAAANARKADDLYRAGIKALTVDLDKAIALLSESLEYNPDNIQAEQHIQRAIKMQATLRKIEQTKSGN